MPIISDPTSGSGYTFNDLIEEVLFTAQGYTAALDQITFLAQPLGATDTTIQVADAQGFSRGLAEIDSELVWVQGVDYVNNGLTLLPNGRGMRGTTAAAHDAGTTVISSPNVPRFAVMNAINDCINSLYPYLYAVETAEFTYDNVIAMGWGIPVEAESILDVRFRDLVGNWQRIRNWEVENSANVTDFPTGKALRLPGRNIPFGQTVQVVYGSVPQPLANATDDFVSVTGLRASCKDVVVLGTLARLAPALDYARLSVKAAAADELDQPRPLGSAINVAKDYRAAYQQRLAEERTVLNNRYPARIHFTR
ncbi:MAG: hypothetical protein ACXVGA_00915 [Mycobacteriaceae bacterium]